MLILPDSPMFMTDQKMAWSMQLLNSEVLQNTESCVKWLQIEGLVPGNCLCPVCGVLMRTTVRGDNQVLLRCRKRVTPHDVRINALENTLFEHSKLGIVKIVILMYYFSQNQTSYDFLVQECSLGTTVVTSNRTIAEWLSFFREVCLVWMDNFFERECLLGGLGVVVEVDVCEIGKRKYDGGRLVGIWMIGLIETNLDIEGKYRSGRYRLELIPENKRDAETIIPLIVKHVEPGTTIVTDLWGTHINLRGEGYHHLTVNHSQHILDPGTRANTKLIESTWQAVKYSLKKKLFRDNLAVYIAEYVYRRQVIFSGEDPFNYFVKAVKHVYPLVKAEKHVFPSVLPQNDNHHG